MLYILGGMIVSAILLLVGKNRRADDPTTMVAIEHGHIIWDNVSTPEDLKTPNLRAVINDTTDVPVAIPTVEPAIPKIDIELAVLVLTGRDFKDRRQAIRSTWGKGHSNVYFVIGKHCPYRPNQRKPYVCEPKSPDMKIDAKYNQQEERLTVELSKEPDVVMVDMIDVYRHLATKLHLGYRWTIENTSAKYVLKIDDDSFARVDSISHWLLSRTAPPKYEMLAGKFGIGIGVTRWGKWAEKKYKPNTYPPWPGGAGHIVSRTVIEYLYQHRDTWVSYQGEDTSMGIWMDKVKADMKVTMTTSKHFITHSGDCHDKSKFVIGHAISIAKLIQCYNTMDEYSHVSEAIKDPTKLGEDTKLSEDWKKEIDVVIPSPLGSGPSKEIERSRTKPAHFMVPPAAPHCPPHRTASKRVAFIITNYNMPERTNQIVESIRKKVQWPVDIIVVDNGSDLMKPSKYTTLRLEKNVQTTNGWLVGLQYAKSLAASRKICYLAYWIWITTCLYDETQKDILTPLAQFLIDHPKAAGIAPALTLGSTTAHKHLKKSSGNKPRKVSFIDELGVLWRASFFDSVGWFDPDELRGFGIDIETGYLARYSGRDVYIHDGVTVKKDSGIAYKMNRMNADGNERGKKAMVEMKMLLNRRYSKSKNSPIPAVMWGNNFKGKGTYTDRLGTWFDDYSTYPTYVSDGLLNIEIGQMQTVKGQVQAIGKNNKVENKKCKNVVKWKKSHGWDVCKDVISDNCIVYAMGIGRFSQWDQMMSKTPYNCEVHSFDPTPTGKNHVKSLKNPGFTYHEMGVGLTDGYQDVFVPTAGDQFTKTSTTPRNGHNPTTISIPVKKIKNIMQELGHDSLDMLKIDIEGGEIQILRDLFSSPVDIKSICAEFHSESPLPLNEIDQLLKNARYVPYIPWKAIREYLGVYLGERCWFKPLDVSSK